MTKLLLPLLLLMVIANAQAQVVSDTATLQKANDTYDLAQQTYEMTKEAIEFNRNREDQFISWLSLIATVIALFIAAFGISMYAAHRKAINRLKQVEEALRKEIVERLAEGQKKNEEYIERIIRSEEWGEGLRKQKKIIILNQKSTGIDATLQKVVKPFSVTIETIASLDDVNTEYIKSRKCNLVVLENADKEMSWDMNDAAIQKAVARIANEICPEIALMYFGSGLFPINQVDSSKQAMVTFTNAPAQLYGNMMNLLKFQDILQEESK